MEKKDIKVLITGEHILGNIKVIQLSGASLFPNHVYDLNPYPRPDGGKDFKVFKKNTSISGKHGCKITAENILIDFKGEGWETVITVYLTHVNVDLFELNESWVDVSIKGYYGLEVKKRVYFYKAFSEIKLLKKEVYNDEKKSVAEFTYQLPASYFSDDEEIKCHVELEDNSWFTFKNAKNKENVTSCNPIFRRDAPAINWKVFLKEKCNASEEGQKINITISYAVSKHLVKVNRSSEKIKIHERPEGRLEIEFHKTSELFTLGKGQITLGELIVKNEGEDHAKSLDLEILPKEYSVLQFLPNHVYLCPHHKETIEVLLENAAITLLPFSRSETIRIFDGSLYLQQISFNLFSVGQPEPYGDYLFEFDGQNLISLEAPNAVFYRGDKETSTNLTVRAKKDINEISLEIINGISFAKLERDYIPSLECNQKYTIPIVVDLEKLNSDLPIIITAKSEYSRITQISIDLEECQRKKPNPVINDISILNSDVYIGGDKKIFSEFTLYNDLPGLTKREGIPINVCEIRLIDRNKKTISWLSLESSQLFINPNCKENIKLVFKPDAIDSEYSGVVNLGYGDKEQSLGKISAQKRNEEKEPKFRFTDAEVIFMPGQDLIIGTLKIEKKKLEKTDDGIILREEEKVVITDEVSFYFLKKEGDDMHYTSVPIETDCIELLIVKKKETCSNENIQDVIPVAYACKEHDDIPLAKYSLTKYSIRKNTPAGKLSLTIRPFFSQDSFIVPLDQKNREPVAITVIKEENPDIAYIPLLTLCFHNRTLIPHDDINNQVEITGLTVEASDNRHKLIEQEYFKILNGGPSKEFVVQIEANAKIPKELTVNFKWGKSFSIKVKLNVKENIDNGWVSLDLGTSGIVMAQYNKNGELPISKINLEYGAPEEQQMESAGIISSAIILQKEKEKYKLQLCPSRVDFKHSDFHFVPVKFLIGQAKVPFLHAFKKQFQQTDPLGITIGSEIVREDAEIVDKMLKYVYQDILERMIDIKKEDIRKFIITYPNTFVPRQLDKIRNLMKDILSSATIVFVPESDAVVAYYLTKRFNGEKGFRKAVDDGEEKILIYDMGAGTLDLSYVVIKYDKETRMFSAHIERRLGAPLGGNYLDALIFEKLKRRISNSDSLSKEDLLNLRDVIRDEIKVATDTSKTLSEVIVNNQEVKWDSNTDIPIQLLYDEIKEDYTKLCTNDVLCSLFGIDRTDPNLKDELNRRVDAFVFSGRGAQFKPLQDKIKDLFGEEKVDNDSISKNEKKESVSLGAIEYCRIFDNPADYNFAILNKNQYLNIGIVYKVLNEYNQFELKYTELINPFLKDWNSIEPENGTRYAEFDILVSDLNLRGVEVLRFVQTPLDKETVSLIIGQNSENNKCFINEMFTLRLPRVNNPEKIKIRGKMDKNNQLTLVFDDIPFKEQVGVEDIERNFFYYKSAWPFNQFNKKN